MIYQGTTRALIVISDTVQRILIETGKPDAATALKLSLITALTHSPHDLDTVIADVQDTLLDESRSRRTPPDSGE